MTGAKYGLMLLSVPPTDDDRERLLLPSLRTWPGALKELIDVEEVEHWQTWLGSIRWDEQLEGDKQIVFASVASVRPDVTDGEDEELVQRLVLAWRAAQLSSPLRPLYGSATIITGALRHDGKRPQLGSVRTHQPTELLPRPYYASRPIFIEKMPWREGDRWMEDWVVVCSFLERAETRTIPEILHMAMLALSSGLSHTHIEFRIPDLVRATECILGLPKNGGGRSEFARRAIRLAPSMTDHWFVGGSDLRDRLVELYQHRSDCVHGKVPFIELRERGDGGEDEAARFEYLAELLARAALTTALSQPEKFEEFGTRERLEDAWACGRFP